jgi:DNA polymerase I
MLRKSKQYYSFDFETTGLQPYAGHRPFSYCTCTWAGDCFIGELPESRKKLQAFLNDTSIAKICHNLKFELSMLAVDGYTVPENTEWHDTLIMRQILHNLSPKGTNDLGSIAWELGGWPKDLDIEIERMGNMYGNYANIPKEKMHPYQKSDGQRTMLIFLTYYEEIKNNAASYEEYLNEIELIKTTQRMEQRGIMLDMQGVEETIAFCDREVRKALEDVKNLTGEAYDLAKPMQVRKLLYTKYKLPILGFTDSGLPSTEKDTLVLLRERYKHPIIDLIQKYRSYEKGGAIIRGYRNLADKDNIVHPNIKTNHDSTGREACDSPNLQNVSKAENQKNPFIVPARQCFRARPGHLLWDADEAQIELRLIVDKADCQKMIKRMKAGEKLHLIAAKLFYGDKFKSKKESPALYSAAKNAHFQMWYGGGLEGFAATAVLNLEEAEKARIAYQTEFPESRTFVSKGKKETDLTGKTITAFGRPLEVPHDRHYAWFNYYIQGTAASIIKHAQNRIDRGWNKNWGGGLILTVHDSIMFETPCDMCEASVKQLKELVRESMTKFQNIKVPLDIEANCGKGRWNQLEEIAI